MTNWIEISQPRLTANYARLQEAAGPAAGPATAVLAVVKANGYGHGAEACAVALARAGAPWLGVGTAEEGARVRLALESALPECATRILLMCGFLPDEVPLLARHNLTPVLWTRAHIDSLSGSDIAVHVEIDTGMNRQGVPPGTSFEAVLDALRQAGLRLDGLMTHFAAADSLDPGLTLLQQRRFEQAVAQVRARDLHPRWLHAGGSSTLDNPATPGGASWLPSLAATLDARPMVRCGIALYGYTLPLSGPASAAQSPRIRNALQPVLAWKTRISDIREIAAGESVGYNATFTATKPTRVALLRVGYANGLRRELSSTNDRPSGWVVVHTLDGSTHRAPVLGRVSMNLTSVDITGIAAIAPGDEVTLLGDGITAEDHARLARTISYEILCGLRTT